MKVWILFADLTFPDHFNRKSRDILETISVCFFVLPSHSLFPLSPPPLSIYISDRKTIEMSASLPPRGGKRGRRRRRRGKQQLPLLPLGGQQAQRSGQCVILLAACWLQKLGGDNKWSGGGGEPQYKHFTQGFNVNKKLTKLFSKYMYIGKLLYDDKKLLVFWHQCDV